MVMSDRNTDEYKNGRRLRSDSPDSSDDSGSSDDSDRDHGMRVGRDFQAIVPEYKPDGKFDPKAEAMLVWAPSRELSGVKTDEYINFAKEKHGYNTEQALGMLFWHKHNVEKAIADLPNFTPFPDEWTVEDKVLFEQAFSFHGKSFHRIRQMLPDKSIASLVKYYYSWKKTRSRTSLMDRQARKLSQKEGDSDGRSEDGSSDSEETENKENGKEDKASCSNCSVKSSQLNPTPKGSLCNTCYQYWRRTGLMRTINKNSESRHEQRHSSMKHKRKPPRGMYLNQEDLMSLLTGPPGQPEALLKSLETELVGLKRQVQNNKQMISLQKHKTATGIDHLRSPEAKDRINNRWTNEELLLAVQGVRKYGKNFQAISEVIGNKSESHVRSFFINFRRRYNLDELLTEYEAEHGCDGSRDEDEDIEEEKMEIDNASENSSQVNSQESNGASAPPPLLKQPPGSPKSNMSTSRLLPPQKTGLQQPPPLIRPNGSPATVKTNE